jgi:hypothetical protein
MDYTFLANLLQEFALPENGVLSRVLHKDDKVNVTLFGFRQARSSPHIQRRPRPFSIFWREKRRSNWERTRSTRSQGPSSTCPRCCLMASPRRLRFACCLFR